MAKHRKVRVSFQKNRKRRRRDGDFTRRFQSDGQAAESEPHDERVRAKGGLSRKRTIQVDSEDGTLALGDGEYLRGRVLTAQGLYCVVVTDDGKSWRCYTRKLLKSFASDARNVVATGDWVWFRPAPGDEGMIHRVEPRDGVLTRRYRRRDQIVAANVQQVLIVCSLFEPELKPNLVDRYLVSAEQGGVRPIVCFNKLDLAAEPFMIQPLVGVYSQLGYTVILASAQTKLGIKPLRAELRDRETVVVGQSGVGKSSLLNALEPKFHLKVGGVSAASRKGRHTTTTAQLLRLAEGGTVVDTPGIRQLGLEELEADEVAAHFPEIRPFAIHCRLPGCTHTHEERCAVKTAVRDGCMTSGRYQSYVRLLRGEERGGGGDD